jgi:prephenate dehydrogenase
VADSELKLGHVVIIGLGLIGGSLALALKKHKLAAKIVGISRSPDTLAQAQQRGVIDSGSTQLDTATAQQADLIFIATPLGAFPAVFEQLSRLPLKQGCIITDGGSAKQYVIDAAQAAFGVLPGNLIPAHPIAGKELSGVAAAEADLYVDHRVIITPTEVSDRKMCEQVAKMWRAVGACVETMSPSFHDEVFAATSHLPHLLAFLLVDMLNEHPELGNIFKYTAGGFRDFTRIASSDPTMWRDIALYNHAAIAKWLKNYRAELDKMVQAVEARDEQQLFSLFAAAKAACDEHIVRKQTL